MQHLFIAMESDYDGAWIYGVYTTLDYAMGRLGVELLKDPKYSIKDRYMFVEEWVLNATNRLATYDYKV